MNKRPTTRTVKNGGKKNPPHKAAPVERVDFFEKYTCGKGALLCFLALFGICVFVFFDYLTFNRLYVFKGIASDSYNAVLPSLVHLSRYLRTDGIPRWSFYVGMGQNIFPEGLNSPFTALLILLPFDKIPFGMAYVEVLKIMLAGLCFYGYLRTIPLTKYASFIGSVLYAFSGFIIVGSGWFSYSSTGVYIAFLLLAFEKLYRENDIRWFPLAVALLASLSFSLYTYGLFLLLYSIFRFLDENSWNVKNYFRLLLKMCMLGLLGVAISFVCFLSATMHMVESPRVSGNVGYFQSLKNVPIFGLENWSITRANWGIPFLHLKTIILRMFSSDLMGTGAYFRGWYNYLEAPLFYCGLLTLLLVPSVWASLDKRRKCIYGVFAGIWAIILIFPYFRYAYNLFAGDYYKTGISLIVTLVMLYYGLRALDYYDRIPKTNPWYLLASYVGALALLFGINFPDRPGVIQEDLRASAAVYLTIYAALLYLMRLSIFRNVAKIALLAVVVVEIAFFSHISVNQRLTMTPGELHEDRTGYNDFTVDAAAWLKRTDQGFYRVTKDYFSGTAIHTSFNDAEIQDYYGTRTYSSFNQLNYVDFLQKTGIISDTGEMATRWIVGLRNRPLLQTMCTVKYNFTKAPASGFYRIGFDSIAQFGDVTVERNNFFLPLGFTYDKYVTYGDMMKVPSTERREAMLNASVIDDTASVLREGLQNLNPTDTSVTDLAGVLLGNLDAIAHFRVDVADLKRDTLSLSIHRQNYLKGSISLARKKIMFFSIPFDKGWHARVDGVASRLYRVNVGFTGLPLQAGNHTVELIFEPPYWQVGVLVSVLGVLAYVGLLLFLRKRKSPVAVPDSKA